MADIHVVIVDDDEDFVIPFSVMFRDAWAESHPQVYLTFDHLQSADQAIARLESDSAPTDVLVAEMLFAQATPTSTRTRPIRTTVITRALRHDVPVIVALAKFSDESAGVVREQCESAGATTFLYKERVGPETLADLCNTIYRRLVEANVIQHIPVVCAPGDLLARSVVSEVGAGAIGWLYTRLFPNGTVDRLLVGYVAQGGSGAYLLKVKAEGPDGSQQVALKLSRDRESLRRQVQGQPAIGQIAFRLYSDCEPRNAEQIPHSMGWHAIAHGFADGTRTLKDWLLSDASPERAEVTLKGLFLRDGLKALYESSQQTDHARSVLESLQPTLMSRARFARHVQALKPMILQCSDLENATYDAALDRVDRFVNSGEVGGHRGPSDVVKCRCHGDLHTGNVLVHVPDGLPLLIDLAGGFCHWASDVARLVVDLLVSCYDSPIVLHRWESVPEWAKLFIAVSRRSVDLPVDPTTKSNLTVLAAIRWMLANVGEACPAVQTKLPPHRAEWEFQAAIAMELLYSVSRGDVSPPKRVACFLASLEVLGTLELPL